MNTRMAKQAATKDGFIAALDQSGGSTPKALSLYGIKEGSWSSEEEMYELVHAMRARIIKSPAFTGDKVMGAILFERTMDSEIDGVPTAQYLWEKRGVVPFLKVDKGLADPENGVRLMKPMPKLDALLERAVAKGIFGTKMRSVIDAANPAGIAAVVAQQFEIGKQILAHGLMPIIEPEVTISIPDKAKAEDILLAEITKQLNALPGRQAGHAEAHSPDEAEPLPPARRASARDAGGGAVGRLFPRRGERKACPEHGRDRQLLASADGGPVGAAERQGVQRCAGRCDREHIPGLSRGIAGRTSLSTAVNQDAVRSFRSRAVSCAFEGILSCGRLVEHPGRR